MFNLLHLILIVLVRVSSYHGLKRGQYKSDDQAVHNDQPDRYMISWLILSALAASNIECSVYLPVSSLFCFLFIIFELSGCHFVIIEDAG